MRRRSPIAWTAAVVLAACVTRAPRPTVDQQLGLAANALADGALEDARELVAEVRQRDPWHIGAARWSALLADMLWRDDEAIREQTVAVRLARRDGDRDQIAELRGRLGELLFQSGRWGESASPLLDGAVGEHFERRRAFAILAASLPFMRRFSGPLVNEQPLLRGSMPEFVCGTRERLRPFMIDTGTSMTTVASGFADELGVRNKQPAGNVLDGAGRELPARVGSLPDFRIGSVDIGAVPVMVVDDSALELRDLHGGPERVPRGVLGLDLLAACRLTVDPERGSVVIELSQGLPENESVQCLRVDGRCIVPVSVAGRRLWFVLDTGASHSSLTTRGLEDLPGGGGRAMPTFRRVRTVGGGVLSVREVRDLVLQCSDARFLQVTLPVVDRGARGVFPIHGVLGNDLLNSCRLTFDRGRARLTVL